MAQYIRGTWNADFTTLSPVFDYLRPDTDWFLQFQQWPGLTDYQAFLDIADAPVTNLAGLPVRCVEQDFFPQAFNQHYAPRIYLTGEMQTRRENWHDFFQVITWRLFPRTKARINALHFPHAQKRFDDAANKHRRSPLENMLSQFDECGAIVVSDAEDLLTRVRNFEWQSLFMDQRNRVKTNLQCIVFGHALLEKAITPYIGMTAKAVLLRVDSSYFSQSRSAQLNYLDSRLAQLFGNEERPASPQELSPLPVLGMPGWWPDQSREFYANASYFRPGRKTQMRVA